MASKLKGKKKGRRVPVKVGTNPKTKKAIYAYIFEYVCGYFGIKPETKPLISKTKVEYYPRGSVGAGSIRLPRASTANKVVKQTYYAVPMPGGMTHKEISGWINSAITKNKPKSYITKQGRTVSVLDGAKMT